MFTICGKIWWGTIIIDNLPPLLAFYNCVFVAVRRNILLANVAASKQVLSAPACVNAFYARITDIMQKKGLFTPNQKLMSKKINNGQTSFENISFAE